MFFSSVHSRKVFEEDAAFSQFASIPRVCVFDFNACAIHTSSVEKIYREHLQI